jgi:hypothetical protein
MCAHAGADSNTTQWLKTFPNIKALADEFEFYFYLADSTLILVSF